MGVTAKRSAKAKRVFLPLLSSEVGENPAAKALCGDSYKEKVIREIGQMN